MTDKDDSTYRVNVVEKITGEGKTGDRIIQKVVLGPFNTLAEAENAKAARYAEGGRGTLDIWLERSYLAWTTVVEKSQPRRDQQ